MLLNRYRALEYLNESRLDAVVVTSPANITYFTDYSCWLDPLFKEYMTSPGASSQIAQRFALFPVSGDPALIVSPIMGANALDMSLLS
jgi:Xaa-Pro aminopeptidase